MVRPVNQLRVPLCKSPTRLQKKSKKTSWESSIRFAIMTLGKIVPETTRIDVAVMTLG